MKKDRWKQKRPRDEMVILLNAIRGNLSNVTDGILSADQIEKRLKPYLDDIEHISKLLPEMWTMEEGS